MELSGSELSGSGSAGQAWAPRTIKTLLNRLVKKGAVAMDADGRRYLYRARVARDAVVRRETRSFLSNSSSRAISR